MARGARRRVEEERRIKRRREIERRYRKEYSEELNSGWSGISV